MPRWITAAEAFRKLDFISSNVSRVEPADGDDSTGTIGDLTKPFLTVQGAINALEAVVAANEALNTIAVLSFDILFFTDDTNATYFLTLDAEQNGLTAFGSPNGGDFDINWLGDPVTVSANQWHNLVFTFTKIDDNNYNVTLTVDGGSPVQSANTATQITDLFIGAIAGDGVSHRSIRNISLVSRQEWLTPFSFPDDSFDSTTGSIVVSAGQLRIDIATGEAYATKALSIKPLADVGPLVLPGFPVIDIGSNAFTEDVTTSLTTLVFIGLGAATIDSSTVNPFNSLTLTDTGDLKLLLMNLGGGTPNSIIANCNQLEVHVINAETDGITNSGGPINITGSGLNSFCYNISCPGDDTIILSNVGSASVNSAGSVVFLQNSNTPAGTFDSIVNNNTSPIFPDSDPHVAGAGYWAIGVLTRSNG